MIIMELYSWQKDAYIAWSKNSYRGQVECSTGVGKTFFSIVCMKLFRVNTIIVVPTIVLQKQWQKSLIKEGIDKKNISIFPNKKNIEKNITITTIHSVSKLKNQYKMAVLDEVHRFSAEIFFTNLKTFFNKNKILYSLGLSATIHREDSAEFRINSLIGKVFYRMSKNEAQQYLNPYIIKNIPVSLTEIEKEEYDNADRIIKENFRKFCGMSDILKTAKNWSDPRARNACSLLKAVQKRKSVVCNSEEKIYKTLEILKEHENEKILVFNEFIKTGEILLKKLEKNNKKAAICRSKAKKLENNIMISKFETDKDTNVLLAIRMLDEGINLPDISICIISSGNSTKRQIIQRVGRGIRKKEGKEKTIIYQLYCANTVDEKNVISRTKFV